MKIAPRPIAGQLLNRDDWQLDKAVVFADYELEDLYGSFDTKELWDRSITTNNSQHAYADINQTGLNPFILDGDSLAIRASRLPKEYRLAHYGRQFASGHLSSFTMGPYLTFGRISATMRLPEGDGLWPAFWLYPKSARFDKVDILPEVDVMEQINDDPATYYSNIHHYANGFGLTEEQFKHVCPPDVNFYKQKHVWGLERMPGYYAFYLDNHYMKVVETPADPLLEGELFFMLQLAVGGNWPGPVDEDFQSADFNIWDVVFERYIGPDALAESLTEATPVSQSLLTQMNVPTDHPNIDVMRRLEQTYLDANDCHVAAIQKQIKELL